LLDGKLPPLTAECSPNRAGRIPITRLSNKEVNNMLSINNKMKCRTRSSITALIQYEKNTFVPKGTSVRSE